MLSSRLHIYVVHPSACPADQLQTASTCRDDCSSDLNWIFIAH
jgi:hypothetical protein